MAPKIKVINGNSTIKEDVAKALEGQDAVIVALGTRHDLGENIAQSIFKNFVVANIVLGLVLLGSNFFSYSGFTTVMSDSLKLILDLMCEMGIKTISVCMSCKNFVNIIVIASFKYLTLDFSPACM